MLERVVRDLELILDVVRSASIRRMPVPQLGEVLSYDLVDAVGRVRLDDGTELRFGRTAIPDSTPVAGTRVRVLSTAPHPLGGLRATSMECVVGSDEEESALASRRDEVMRTAKEQQRLHDAPLIALQEANYAAGRIELERRLREQQEAERLAREESATAIGDRVGLDAWRAALTHFGLGPLVPTLLGTARPTARLVARTGDVASTHGATKLGGHPDLPASFQWPTYGDESLSFILQVALSDVPAEVCESLGLAPSGLLSFFYAVVQQPWGHDASERGAAHIAYFPSGTVLARTAPLVGRAPREEIAMTFTLDTMLPPVSGDGGTIGFDDREEEDDTAPRPVTPTLAELRLSPEATEKYERAFQAYQLAHDDFAHLVGGYAMPIQGEMESQCAQIDAQSVASEWRLLLQLDSGADTGEWGDDGRLYFWVRERDVKAGDFGRPWCILQCY